MAGTALKGQCDLISIMVNLGVQFKRKRNNIFMEKRILTRLEIKPLILMTNKHCHWLFLLLIVFRFRIICIGNIIKKLEIFKELVFDLVLETDVCCRF